ncbi:MAG: serine/threonine-protein kinase [Anaerolineae bacterium]
MINQPSTPATPTTSTLFTGHITHPRAQLASRIIWWAIAILSLITALLGFMVYYEYTRQPPDALQSILTQFAISHDVYFLYNLIAYGIVLLGFAGVGFFIYWRRPYERFAIFASAFLIAFGAAQSPAFIVALNPTYTTPLLSVYRIFFTLINALSYLPLAAFFIMFPDGRFVPGWTRYLTIFCMLFSLGWGIFPDGFYQMQGIMGAVVAGGLTIEFGGICYAQWLRYHHNSTPLQRQQTKWFLLSLAITAIVTVVGTGVQGIIAQTAPAYFAAFTELTTPPILLVMLAIPFSIGFAILRYRLWDIDLVINRSLVYGVVTLVLGVIFILTILILQSLLGSSNALASLIISAIGPILLFNPARRRAQHFVDRYLYRLRFDLNDLSQAQKLPEIKNPGALSGRTLGAYQVLDVLGRGGMGEVYKGIGEGKTVALKILPDNIAQQPEFRARFQREAETGMNLAHPNIAHVYSSGSTDGVTFMAMEYVEGLDLSQHLKQHGSFGIEDTRDILRGLAAALDYAHAKGLVHRDLKPSNIMLRHSADGETFDAVLMDFGVAKIDDGRTRYTGSGAIGTIDYMAPEQITAAKEVDRRADIYALGVVTYELLTGKRPFEGSAPQVLFAHIQQPAPDPRDLNPAVPRAAAHALQKALAKKPEDRFTSAGEFAAAL